MIGTHRELGKSGSKIWVGATAERLAMISRLLRLAGPLGMPLVRKMDKDLWEVRIKISDGRIARV